MSKSALKAIYSGSFKDRPRFDGGGYVDYSGGDLSPITPTATYMSEGNSGAPSAADISGLTANAATMPTGGSMPTTSDVGTVMNGGSTPGTESSNGSGALSTALKALGLGGGNTSNAAALNAIAGLLSAAGHYKQSAAGSKLPAMPALPGSAPVAGYGPPGGYNFANYAPKGQTAAPPPSSYFTYGSGPEQQFFQQVQPGGGKIAPVTMARGGKVPHFDMGGMVPNIGGPQQILGQGAMAQPGQTPMTPRPMMGAPQQAQPQVPQRPTAPSGPAPLAPSPPSTMMQRMQAARPQVRPFAMGGSPGTGALSQVGQSRHVTGPGDGTSDSIPARLANGEYVIDAQAVSMLGNGDNSAGAKRLDEFRKNLRQHKGGALAKGQMAPDAKPIHKYMGGQS
jgi:hypothetical protein